MYSSTHLKQPACSAVTGPAASPDRPSPLEQAYQPDSTTKPQVRTQQEREQARSSLAQRGYLKHAAMPARNDHQPA